MAARRGRPHHHSVYVVELSKEVLNEPRFSKANQDYRLGFPCVYVGMTGLSPDVRFDKHKAGIQSNKFVRLLRPAPRCRGSTRRTTRCRTTARATWKSSSPSRCARRATASGRDSFSDGGRDGVLRRGPAARLLAARQYRVRRPDRDAAACARDPGQGAGAGVDAARHRVVGDDPRRRPGACRQAGVRFLPSLVRPRNRRQGCISSPRSTPPPWLARSARWSSPMPAG